MKTNIKGLVAEPLDSFKAGDRIVILTARDRTYVGNVHTVKKIQDGIVTCKGNYCLASSAFTFAHAQIEDFPWYFRWHSRTTVFAVRDRNKVSIVNAKGECKPTRTPLSVFEYGNTRSITEEEALAMIIFPIFLGTRDKRVWYYTSPTEGVYYDIDGKCLTVATCALGNTLAVARCDPDKVYILTREEANAIINPKSTLLEAARDVCEATTLTQLSLYIEKLKEVIENDPAT